MSDQIALYASFLFYAYLLVVSFRFLQLNFFFIFNAGKHNHYFDPSIKIKDLLFSIVHDSFINLFDWNVPHRIRAINERAGKYEDKET